MDDVNDTILDTVKDLVAIARNGLNTHAYNRAFLREIGIILQQADARM